ncbi:MAG: beta-ketoacyl-[acyl-carrier-protein] synthase family protein [Planctomycetes bacterium]|nr:beta-ketoacyl-[acyl-carrier-protein] synthase family protein [Planctomycetota bacterium]
MPPPIYITGIGLISAAGGDVSQTLSSFRNGAPAAEPKPFSETTLDCPAFPAAQKPQSSLCQTDCPSRTVVLALHAVEEALERAGRPDRETTLRIGVCMGTTVACQLNNLRFYKQFRQASRASLEPVRDFLNGNLAEFVAASLDAHGPRATVVNACSSGADAIGTAVHWLQNDLCDIAVAGGADELNRIPICGFHSLGIMSDNPCKPFDRNRDGLNLGEGAGALVLESETSARRRGREQELFLKSYAAGCDAHHITAPHPEGVGLKLALEYALKSAEIKPDDIAFVNAHGTATPDNDQVEGNVLAEFFGEDLVFLSTKGYTGHTLGAAGALEAGFTALALQEGWLPANRSFQNADPDIPISPVVEKTPIVGRAAVSTSLAFGGNNAAIVIGRGT